MMDITKILNKIPHRYPLLLVDKVLDIQEDSLRALKNVTINEPFFQGHFPGKPIMPGVLIIESLAQACSLLAMSKPEIVKMIEDGGLFLFAGIDKAKFKRLVVPGDTLILDVKLLRRKSTYAVFEVQASVDGKIAAVATISVILVSSEKNDTDS